MSRLRSPHRILESDQSVAIPGYRLGEVLGRGAMGIVLRAERLADGQLVALKTVRATTASTLASIRREIVALSRVRHSGIARIVDHGVAKGVPWYAMDLLEGRTLRDFIREQFPESGSPRAAHVMEVLAIIHRLCAPLSLLHSRGIIHRDLKPENVFLRTDGVPVLVDFGIAVSFGSSGESEIAENMLEFAGTPEYMSPEQIQGRGVDARADLYSLGCILFECLTGRTPFEGKTLGAIISKHLSAAPTPPSRIVANIPAELDALVLALLAKRPADRLGYADDVAAKLEALGVPVAPVGEETPREAYVYRPEFVGRSELMTRFEALLRGQGKLARRVLIDGESGVGKTRFLSELASYAAFRGFVVVPAQCLGAGGTALAAPLAPFRNFLLRVADAAREGGPEIAEQLLGNRGQMLAPYEPVLATLAPEPEVEQPVPPSPGAARAKVFKSLRETLFAYAGSRPLILLIDDLQWADELTLAFIESLEESELERHEAFVVAAYRSEEASLAFRSGPFAEKFAPVTLERLNESAVGAMTATMLALNETPAAFSEFLFRETNGNPFFVAEYLRAAIDQGLLFRDAAGRWQLGGDEAARPSVRPILAPVSIRSVMERRISDLEPAALGLVSAAAVLGREFDSEMLVSMTGYEDLAALDTLRRRKILEEGDAGKLRFSHDKLRELAYASIPADGLPGLHVRAAEAIEQSSQMDRASAFPLLAYHWSRAGDGERAAVYYTLAGDRARDVYANREAIAAYDSALEIIRTGLGALADTGRWQMATRQLEERRADVLILTGADDLAREALGRALDGLAGDQRIGRSSLLLKCARTCERAHRHVEALEYYQAAEAALGPPPESGGFEPGAPLELPANWPSPRVEESPEAYWEQWVRLQVEQVWVHYWLADVQSMERLVARVRPIVEERSRPVQYARFLQALVHHNLRRDRYAVSAETVGYARGALAAAERSGELSAIAYAEFVLGFQLVFSGATGEARPHLDRALASAEHTGDLGLQARCLTYSTVLHRLDNQPAVVREMAERSLELGRTLGMADYVGAAHANLAWVAYREGDGEEMARQNIAAFAEWQSLAPKYPYPFQWLARLHSAALALAHEDSATAFEHVRVTLDPVQHRLPAPVNDELVTALEAWERGDEDLARRRLVLALEHARQVGLI